MFRGAQWDRIFWRSAFGQRPLVRFIQNRWFGLSPAKLTEEVEVKEVEIPVPWGKIAGRHWNYRAGTKPVLCVHGWKDNAASFDKLLPLLVKKLPQYQFVAIDFPGHGRSSHYPPGMLYLTADLLVLYRRIMKYFEWEKISIMAHSMGAQFSLMFAGTHPAIVEKFVAIDALSPIVQTKKEILELIPNLTLEMLKFEDKMKYGTRPTYTYEEVINKLLRTHVGGKMTRESCEILMSRGIEEHPHGSERYRFTHDIRVHFMPVQGVSSQSVAFVMENFRSDILRIQADDGIKYTLPFIEDNTQKWLAFDSMRKPKGNIVTFVNVPGSHHLHLLDPESVVPHISRFLSRRRFAVYDDS